MNINQINRIFLTVFVTAALAGCASAPSHFYTLTSTATGTVEHKAPYAVLVGPVSIPGVVDRPQFTLQTPPNGVAIDEFNRWAEPLNENIARVVAGDLAVLLGTPLVTTKPLANFDPAYRITIDVQRFESVRGQTPGSSAVVVEAVWVIRRTQGGAAHSGRTVAGESAQGDGFDALASAHSRALAKVSADIALAIKAEDDIN